MAQFSLADRVSDSGPNVFVKLERKVIERRQRGEDVISLSIGSPDGPTPPVILQSITQASQDPRNAGYPPFAAKLPFRQAIGQWMKHRFGVEVDPITETVILAGTAQAPTMVALAFLNPGDIALMPDPVFPLYLSAMRFAGARIHPLPIYRGNNYWPALNEIPAEVLSQSKILFLNYPHNPTGAVATLDQLRQAVAFAQQHNLILCYDNAYSEITFDGYVAPGLFQVEGAKQLGIEFHSFSKTYNMAGWRVGFAVGNANLIAGLSTVVTNVDARVPGAIQDGATTALLSDRTAVREIVGVYDRRRQAALDTFARIGWNVQRSLGTFYLWEPVPPGFTSESFALGLLEETGVVVTPGNAFGESGEGYFRMALVVPEEQIVLAVERIGEFVARHRTVSPK